MNETITKLVGRLIANKSPYTTEDQEILEGYSEEKLTTLLSAFDIDEVDETIVDDPVTPVVDEEEEAEEVVLELTEEEQIEALPTTLRAMIRKAQAKEVKERTDLITALAEAQIQTAYTKAALEAKDTEDLTALASALGVGQAPVDFSPRGLTFNREADDTTVPAPPSIKEAIAAKRASN